MTTAAQKVYLAHVRLLARQYEKALETCDDAEQFLSRESVIPDDAATSMALCRFELSMIRGQAARCLGQIEQSLAAFESARRAYAASPALHREARTRLDTNEGLALVDAGHFDAGLTLLHRAFDESEKAEDPSEPATIEFNLAYAYHRRGADGDRQRAAEHAWEAEQVFDRIGHPFAAEVRRQVSDWDCGPGDATIGT